MRHVHYNLDADIRLLIERSAVDLEQFRGAHVLVTGGTGFFGLWLLSAFVEISNRLDGDLNILVVSRSPDKFLQKYERFAFEKCLKFLQGDVTSFKLSKLDITHLVHMATTNASETFAGEEQVNKLDMLYRGTRNTIEQCGASLKNVLFTSSGIAYGNSSSEFISENENNGIDPTNIGSALAIGKLTAEYLVNYYAEKFGYSYTIARCFSFAGPYLPLDIHYAFGNFIQNALDGKDIVIRGDGRDIRSYLYIGDAVAWLLKLLAEPKNLVLNVGSEQRVSIGELAEEICKKTTNISQLKILGKNRDDGNFHRTSYVPSLSKLKNNYNNLEEWTSRDEIIHKMLNILN